MKNRLFIIFSLFASSVFAQDNNDKKVFLDSLSKETTEGNHKYYRIIKNYSLQKDEYEIVDYYLNNQIKAEGLFKSKYKSAAMGEYKEYYQSGKLKSVTNYSTKNSQTDTFYSLYENGNREIEGEYVKIKKDNAREESTLKISSFWDENRIQKVINGNGFMIEKKEFETSSGKIKDGFKDGIWTGNNLTYKIQFTDEYESRNLTKGLSRDVNNKEFNYSKIEIIPEFPGGMMGFSKYVQKKYKTPDVKKNIKGRILLRFLINANGKVDDVLILESLEKDCDNEAIKLINSTDGLWISGEYRGIKINFTYILPIMLDIRAE